MAPYQQGIKARKDGQGRHENPYEGEQLEFVSWLFNPRRLPARDMIEWYRGWEAEDAFQRSKE